MAGEILVGIDGSDKSLEALRWAWELASLTGRAIRAIRAYRLPSAAPAGPSSGAGEAPSPVRPSIEAELRDILTEALGDAGAAVEALAVQGDSAGALIDAAKEARAYLLVIGSRGLGGFRGLLFGSVGRTVVEHASHPVAVVREYVAPSRGGLIVVGADASSASEVAVTWAASLAATLGAEVHAVHALNPDLRPGSATWDELRREAEHDMRRWTSPLRRAGVPHRAEIEVGDARDVLMGSTRRDRPSLVVVGSRGTGLADVVLGSVPRYLAQHLPGVLVVVPGDEARGDGDE